MTQLLYPIGIQSFPNIREGGYIYVDKTSYIHRLVTTGKYYFLSRPRRFGKSLLMSTIEEFFKGQRDLFEGLAISDYDYDWAEYPVLHLDLSGFIVESRESLYIHLEDFFFEMGGEIFNYSESECPGRSPIQADNIERT